MNIKNGHIGLLLLLVFCFFVMYKVLKKQKDIKGNPEITIACIKEYEPGGAKTSGQYIADFHYSGKKYSAGYIGRRNQGILIKNCFPVIFNKSNPEENELLIFPSDFEKFDLQFPDSLSWVKNYDN